jgi:hypothetical protein
MTTTDTIEQSFRRLEARISQLERALASVAATAGQAYQQQAQNQPPSQAQTIWSGVTSSAITARSLLVMGQGTVTPYTTYGGTLANSGSPDVTVFNDTGGTIPSGTVVKFTWKDGQYEFVTQDCSMGAI